MRSIYQIEASGSSKRTSEGLYINPHKRAPRQEKAVAPKPNTLREVAVAAVKYYGQHERFARDAKRHDAPIGAAALAGVEAVPANTSSWLGADDYKEMQVRRTQGRVKGNLEKATEHYKQHEAEYHDLAVMDAHLDGVKINVEQPLEIGQKIEVHTPEHQ